MKKFNIVWILVDSVRRYHSKGDDRSRLRVMDEFGKNSVEFLNTVTSAPSSIMAISSMMTSLPSYYLSRNYDSFRFDTSFFTTINQILKKNRYNPYSFHVVPEMRVRLDRVLDHLDGKYLPKGFEINGRWSNQDLNKLFDELLRRHVLRKPSFMFFHYNCRLDPKTSDVVKDLLDKLDGVGFTEENTIFILCSDHGYPDPMLCSGEEMHQMKAEGMGHDLYLTDDNIMIPFLIRYPGCPKGKKITTTVSSLDIMPTIIDILDLKVDRDIVKNFKGRSLLKLVDGKDNTKKEIKVRSDTRFMAQKGRSTAIRGKRYKYVYHHDTKKEKFYDVKNDKWEYKNIIGSKDKKIRNKIKKFRKEFKKQEKEAIHFQFKYILSRFKKMLGKYFPLKEGATVLILGSSSPEYIKLLLNAANKTFVKPKIEILIKTKEATDILKRNGGNLICYKYNKEIVNLKKFKKNHNKIFNKKYDLIILPYDNQLLKDYKIMLKLSRHLKKRKLIFIDYNMNTYRRKSFWFRAIKIAYGKRQQYLKEPSSFLYDLLRGINSIKNKFRL